MELQYLHQTFLQVGPVEDPGGSLEWVVVVVKGLVLWRSRQGFPSWSLRNRLHRIGRLDFISIIRQKETVGNSLPNSPSPSKLTLFTTLLFLAGGAGAGRGGGKSSSSGIRGGGGGGSFLIGA